MASSVNQSQQILRELLTSMFAWRPGRLAKGTLAMTAGMGLRTLVQGFVFLVVARVLGIADYGAYAAVLALSTTFGCFTGWGTQALLVRDVSRNPDQFAAAWGRALTAIAVSSPFLFAIYIALAWSLLPASISLTAVAFIGFADLIFAPVGSSAIAAYQGCDRLGRAARLTLVPVLPRLVGALALLPFPYVIPQHMRLRVWALLYAVAALAAALYALRMTYKDLGPADKPNRLCIWTSLREGLPFAFSNAALKVYTDIDKMILARLATIEITGAYSAAYRVVDLATVPLFSLLSAAMPHFFRVGEDGVPATLAYAHRILFLPLAYSVLAGIALYLCSGVLPFLLGSTYTGAVPPLQWLAWLPVASVPRLLLQSLLIGGDRQNYVVNILAGGAIFNIILNIWLISLWGWRGAVTATYAAEIGMAFAMCLLALFSQKKHNRPRFSK